jgi:hypothetical protein
LIGTAYLLAETKNQFPSYEDVTAIVFEDGLGAESRFSLFEKKYEVVENGYYFKCYRENGPSSYTVEIEFIEYIFYDSVNNFVLEFT